MQIYQVGVAAMAVVACVGAQGLRSTILWEWLVARAQAATFQV